MEKMLAVIFDNETKAYEGSHALKELDADGSITIHAEAVIAKNADGTVTVKQSENIFPVGTVSGTAIGSLIGLLGGPVGFGIGAMGGALVGVMRDLNVAGVDADFVDEAAAALSLGKCEVIAEISEEWVTPVDTRMEALGGTVFRTGKKNFEDEQRAKEVATLRVEIEQLKTEYAKASADRKAKLKASIDKLNAKLQARLDQAKQRSEQIRNETEAKVHALQKKAEKAQGEIKATLDARIKRIRQEHEESEKKLKHLLAMQLTAAAARLEK